MIDHEGQFVKIYANQAEREAVVLAILDEAALLEYEMPNGSTALRVVSVADPDRSLRRFSYAGTPLRWLVAMLEVGSDWSARPQQSGIRQTPSVAAMYRDRTGKEYTSDAE
jgi:hypothetical protein